MTTRKSSNEPSIITPASKNGNAIEAQPIEPQSRNVRFSVSNAPDSIDETYAINFDPLPENRSISQNGIAVSGEHATKIKSKKKRNLPSSRGTVLTIVGFFLSGLMLILSGIIVLAVEKHWPFRVAGAILLSLGALFVIICACLQQKNINKLRKTLEHDVFKLFSPSSTKAFD